MPQGPSTSANSTKNVLYSSVNPSRVKCQHRAIPHPPSGSMTSGACATNCFRHAATSFRRPSACPHRPGSGTRSRLSDAHDKEHAVRGGILGTGRLGRSREARSGCLRRWQLVKDLLDELFLDPNAHLPLGRVLRLHVLRRRAAAAGYCEGNLASVGPLRLVVNLL